MSEGAREKESEDERVGEGQREQKGREETLSECWLLTLSMRPSRIPAALWQRR